MKPARTALAVVLALFIATPLMAAKKKDANNGIAYYKTVDTYLKPVTLTDDQTAKLTALKKEYEPKFKEAYAKLKILTPEQQTAADEARKAAVAAGKKGKELTAAVSAAVTLTDDQKKMEKAGKKALSALEKEMHGKVLDLLTDEQKTQISTAKGSKSKASAKSDAPATTAPAPSK
jgi:hypothetical protein